jgi:hypothetical protein
MLEGKASQSLAADIRRYGLREPIILLDGNILDARNRYRACPTAGVEPRCAQWRARHQHGPPLAFLLPRDLESRHLNESRWALIAARLSGLGHDAREDQAR